MARASRLLSQEGVAIGPGLSSEPSLEILPVRNGRPLNEFAASVDEGPDGGRVYYAPTDLADEEDSGALAQSHPLPPHQIFISHRAITTAEVGDSELHELQHIQDAVTEGYGTPSPFAGTLFLANPGNRLKDGAYEDVLSLSELNAYSYEAEVLSAWLKQAGGDGDLARIDGWVDNLINTAAQGFDLSRRSGELLRQLAAPQTKLSFFEPPPALERAQGIAPRTAAHAATDRFVALVPLNGFGATAALQRYNREDKNAAKELSQRFEAQLSDRIAEAKVLQESFGRILDLLTGPSFNRKNPDDVRALAERAQEPMAIIRQADDAFASKFGYDVPAPAPLGFDAL